MYQALFKISAHANSFCPHNSMELVLLLLSFHRWKYSTLTWPRAQRQQKHTETWTYKTPVKNTLFLLCLGFSFFVCWFVCFRKSSTMVCILVSGHPFASDSLTDGLLAITSSLVWSPTRHSQPCGYGACACIHGNSCVCAEIRATRVEVKGWHQVSIFYEARVSCLNPELANLGSLTC